MPTYSIQAPNGRTYSIDGPEGASREEVIRAILHYAPEAGNPPPSLGERAGSALSRGVAQLAESGRGISMGVDAAMGNTQAAGAQAQAVRDRPADKGPAPISYAELERTYSAQGLLAAAKKLPGFITEQALSAAPSMAVPIAAGAGAAAVSGPFAPVVGPAVGVATYGAQQFGNFMNRQAQEGATGATLQPGNAAKAAALTAPLGFVVDRFTLGLGKAPMQVVGQQITKELAKRTAAQAGGRLLKGAGIGVIAEAPTEVLEQAAERWQAGLALTGDEAKAEYKEAFAGAAALGGVAGAAGQAYQMRGEGAQVQDARAQADRAAIEDVLLRAGERQLPPEAAPGSQGSVFPSDELPTPKGPELDMRGQPVDRTLAEAPVDTRIGVQPNLGLESARTYADLELEHQRLLKGPKNAAVVARIAELSGMKTAMLTAEVQSKRAAKTLAAADAVKASKSAFTQPAAQVELRGAVAPESTFTQRAAQVEPPRETTRESVPADTDLFGNEVYPSEEAPLPDFTSKRAAKAAGVPNTQLDLTEIPEPTLRGKPPAPEPLPLTSAVKPEEVGVETSVWARGKKGQAFLSQLAGLDALTARDQRESLVPKRRNSHEGVVFDAIFPETQSATYDEGADRPATEPGLGVPPPDVREPGAEPADAIGASPLDGGAVADGSRSAGPDVTPTAASTPALTPAADVQGQLQAIVDDRTAPPAKKRQAAAALDALTDPELNRTKADKAGNLRLAAKTLEDIQRVHKEVSAGGYEGPASQLPESAAAELGANNLVGALHELSQAVKHPVLNSVAERLKMLLKNTDVVLTRGMKTSGGVSARGGAARDGRTIWLNQDNGMDVETVLHESVHAATERILSADPTTWTPQQRAAIQELRSLWTTMKADPEVRMSPPAQGNLSEFVAEALSNRVLQNQLHARPWKRMNGWDGFKTILLKLLGVETPRTMLEATLASVDTVFAAPEPGASQAFATKFSLDSIVRSSEVMQDQPGMVVGAVTSMAQAFSATGGVSPGTKLRVSLADVGASVAQRVNLLFDGTVRTARGLINPMGLYYQAQDYVKLLGTYARDGELYKDPMTGQYVTRPGAVSTEKVLHSIRAWGAKQGMDYARAAATTAKMWEAVRLDGIRKRNAADPSDSVPINKLSNQDPRTADQQIDVALAEYAKHPELQSIKKDWDSIKNGLVDHMVRVGRLTADEGASWKEALDYVPFDRVRDLVAAEKFVVKRSMGRGMSQLGNLRELMGSSTREVRNVIENGIELQGWMVGQVLRQDATLSTLRVLEAMGAATFRGGKAPDDMTKAVRTYVKGVPAYFELPTRWDVVAFSEMSQPKNAIVSMFQAPANFLRRAITAMPPFAVSQVAQDIQRGFVTSGVERPMQTVWPILKNFAALSVAELFGRTHPIAIRAGRMGIAGGVDIDVRNPAESILYELGLRKRGAIGALWHRMEGITRASDLAVRMAIYDRTMTESRDALLAQTRAREFINFRRRGASPVMATMTAVIPFFNAYVQGMDVLYRAATGNAASASTTKAEAKRQFVSRVATMAMFAAIYSMCRAGDEEYDDADPRIKASNWLLPGNVRIPVPGELGAIFKVTTETALDYYRRSGTPEEMEATEAIITALKYSYEQYFGRVTPIPAAVKPVIEAWFNYSTFTGQAIEGRHQQGLDSSQRVNTNTSELAKAIADFTSAQFGEGATISPIKIDHILQGYTGSVAGVLSMATDQLINPDRLDRPMNKYWMLSAFLYDPTPTGRKAEAYALNDKIMGRIATLDHLSKTDLAAAEAYANAHSDELAMAQALRTVFQQSGNIRAQIKWLTSSAEAAQQYTQEERRANIDMLRRQDNELFKFVRSYRNYLKDPDAAVAAMEPSG